VKRRARELGLAGERAPWQDWTPAEVQFLETHAGTRHVNWLSKQLGRTLTSVVLKLKRMHLSRRVREGYSLRDLEMALGIDHRRLTDLVEQGKLRAEHQGTHPRDRWMFTERDVLAFLRSHPTAYRLARVDQLWFLDLVFGGRIGDETTRAA
jgi:hypothetical protein